MTMRFERIGEADIEALAAWFPLHEWPYHARSRVDAAWVREQAGNGYFFGAGTVAFWAVADDSTRVGVVRVFELSDTTPLLDVRIGAAARRQGFGTEALTWITTFVFEGFSEAHRLGGYTRADNLPMRRLFEKCGYVQEARHRQAWRVGGTLYADAVGYAALRSDWVSRTTTPVHWP